MTVSPGNPAVCFLFLTVALLLTQGSVAAQESDNKRMPPGVTVDQRRSARVLKRKTKIWVRQRPPRNRGPGQELYNCALIQCPGGL